MVGDNQPFRWWIAGEAGADSQRREHTLRPLSQDRRSLFRRETGENMAQAKFPCASRKGTEVGKTSPDNSEKRFRRRNLRSRFQQPIADRRCEVI